MYRTEISTQLNSFVPISLCEMDAVMLMSRVEAKYVFSARKLPKLLEDLESSYKVLEINNIRSFQYNTTYLDTPEMQFFTDQLRGKLNRHKIRYRTYESTGDSFLEIKKRTNKDRTEKWRIANCLSPVFDQDALTFMTQYLPHESSDLKPALINGFTRITLVGKEVKERITLDYDIKFANPGGPVVELPFLAIAEIKHERMAGYSPIVSSMKRQGIHPSGFSKYCMGNAIIKEIPRKNTLKQNLLLLNKIQNEYFKYA
jgi:hypothetical protein